MRGEALRVARADVAVVALVVAEDSPRVEVAAALTEVARLVYVAAGLVEEDPDAARRDAAEPVAHALSPSAEEARFAVLGVEASRADVAVVAGLLDESADAARESDALTEPRAGVEVVARVVLEDAGARERDALALGLSVVDVASGVVDEHAESRDAAAL